MDIHNNFEVPLPPDKAWAVLLDIPRIAPCMPGAKLISVDGNDSYTGEVQVRLGPVLLSFRGQAKFTSIDAGNHRATVHAEGRDQKGRGGASADVAFKLVGIPSGTRVEIDTSLSLSGSVAQYGRGAAMISDLANLLIGQFAANLRRELAASEQAEAAPATAATAPAEDAAAPAGQVPPAGNGAPAAPAREAAPIQGFRLGLRLLWRQLLRLFGRSPASG
jgi:uncharacterized protein